LRLRLLVDGPRSPRANMAVDEAILLKGPDTLRVYTWSPPGLSLGRRTPVASVNLHAAARLGVEVVRRPTGGAALYHGEMAEVTYSIVASDPSLLSLSVEESAARIAEGVAEAARLLGAGDAMVGGFQGPGGESLCYLNPGASDVVAGGRKVSGSAQLRVGGRLLQHGTLLLTFDPSVWWELIPTRTPPGMLGRYVGGLSDIVGSRIGVEEAVEALIEGFRRALGAEFYEAPLTAAEAAEAARLARGKYGSERWTIHGGGALVQ